MKFETWCLIQDQTLKRELKIRRADKTKFEVFDIVMKQICYLTSQTK